MAYQTEIVAMLSGGMSFRRLMRPYFLGALLIGSLSLTRNLWLIPISQRHIVNFESQYIKRKQNNSQMDRFINEYREMVGQKVAYNRGKSGLLAISRMLKEKHLLGVLYDQDTNDDGVEIELFGKKCITPYGPAALSRLYGSPILPIFMHNNPDGTLRAKIYPPLYTPRTKDKEKDFYDVTKELITVLEHEIIENPPMWFWVHDRWKDGRQRFAGKK